MGSVRVGNAVRGGGRGLQKLQKKDYFQNPKKIISKIWDMTNDYEQIFQLRSTAHCTHLFRQPSNWKLMRK